MSRIGHGDPIGLVDRQNLFAFALRLDIGPGPALGDFGYMFSPDPATRPGEGERLLESADTLQALDALGSAMAANDPGETNPIQDRVVSGDGKIPAGFTYFGQFIDHDITIAFEPLVAGKDMIFSDFTPLANLDEVRNGRTPLLELDSVYGPSGNPGTEVPEPLDGRMALDDVSIVGPDQVTKPFLLVPGKGTRNDLPRKPRSADTRVDREARIGDPRNDENLIVAQMHVAFLKAHNRLVDQGRTFEQAREEIILLYQAAIVDDYLPRICDEAVLNEITVQGPRFFTPERSLFMPVEFSAAGFRFGHSMVRSQYDFNLNFDPAQTGFAFTFTALQGNLAPDAVPGGKDPQTHGSDHFPHNWIIQWERFLELDDNSPPQAARPIDPNLTPILAGLRTTLGDPEQGIAARLAQRNLRRGYLFGLPTGQAVASRIGAQPVDISPASTGLSAEALGPFANRTPLWLYVLAEAKQNGGRLGSVGTTILAETFITLIRKSTPSIFDASGARVTPVGRKLAEVFTLAATQDA